MKTTCNLLFKIEAGNYPIWQGGGVSKETDCERDFPFLAATSSSRSDVVTQFVSLLVRPSPWSFCSLKS